MVMKSPETHIESPAVTGKHGDRFLAPARYRHPGDMIRLIIAALVLAWTLAVSVAAHAIHAGANAAAVTALTPSTTAGRVLAGLVQVLFAAAVIAAVVVTLRYRRFRLLASLAGGAVGASAVLAGIIHLAGGTRPLGLAAVEASGGGG
jgi:hypothetical protein